jgi:hypothetical protein
MLKNGKYDSKDKSVLFLFLFIWRKSIILELLNTAQSQLFQAGTEKKNLSSTYCHIAVLLNLQLQLVKFKNNEEKAIIVFCNFDIYTEKKVH